MDKTLLCVSKSFIDDTINISEFLIEELENISVLSSKEKETLKSAKSTVKTYKKIREKMENEGSDSICINTIEKER